MSYAEHLPKSSVTIYFQQINAAKSSFLPEQEKLRLMRIITKHWPKIEMFIFYCRIFLVDKCNFLKAIN